MSILGSSIPNSQEFPGGIYFRHMFGFLANGEIKDLQEIVRFLKRYLANLDELQGKASPELLAVTGFLIAETIDLYDAVIILRKKGRFLPCLMLARSMVENSINLQYIYQKNTEQRARNFHAFPLKDYLKRAEGVEPRNDEDRKMLNRMREEIKSHKPEGERSYHWDGKSIGQIFRELELERMHSAIYSRLSGFTHAQFGSRNFQEDRPYTNFLKTLLTKEVFLSVLESLRSVSEHFDLAPDVLLIDGFPGTGPDIFFTTNRKRTKMVDEEEFKKWKEKG